MLWISKQIFRLLPVQVVETCKFSFHALQGSKVGINERITVKSSKARETSYFVEWSVICDLNHCRRIYSWPNKSCESPLLSSIFHQKTKRTLKKLLNSYFLSNVPGVPKKFLCLMLCKLKTTVFTQSAFIYSDSRFFALNFSIKQFRIG